VLLYDGRLWHSAGAHNSDAIRYALHGFFSAPQIRSQENYSLSLLPDVRRQLPQRLLELCGFKTWWSIGIIDDFRQEMVDPDQIKLGRLELAAIAGSGKGS
jgi:ectoine hydroxylase-related dioxygenase (phytanoyl-CoA dioxygenase family)